MRADEPRGSRPRGRVVAHDVARHAGLSQKTVSRVINGDPSVSSATRTRVEASIAELGYRPNRAARALRGRSHSIGVMAIGSSEYGPTSSLVATERAVRAAGYSLVVAHVGAGDTDDSVVHWLLEQGIEGLVVNKPTGALNLTSHLGDLPVLSLSGHTDLSHGTIVTTVDGYGGARQTVEHLLSLGHRTVHHIAGPRDWPSAADRHNGWRDALAAAGAPIPELIAGDWSAQTGFDVGQQLVSDHAITAIFAANDDMALGIMRAYALAGRPAPDHISVVGFDDGPTAAYFTPALTTVRQDLAKAATVGVQMLLEAIKTRTIATPRTTIPTELIVRESTAPPPLATERT